MTVHLTAPRVRAQYEAGAGPQSLPAHPFAPGALAAKRGYTFVTEPLDFIGTRPTAWLNQFPLQWTSDGEVDAADTMVPAISLTTLIVTTPLAGAGVGVGNGVAELPLELLEPVQRHADRLNATIATATNIRMSSRRTIGALSGLHDGTTPR